MLELSRVLAGPWAAQTLADLGASVIKVERPGSGDDTRAWGPPFVARAQGGEDAAYFLSTNRGKRSVAIDFTQPRGQDLVRALAARSDVLIENFKVGGLARYGLDVESLRAAHRGVGRELLRDPRLADPRLAHEQDPRGNLRRQAPRRLQVDHADLRALQPDTRHCRLLRGPKPRRFDRIPELVPRKPQDRAYDSTRERCADGRLQGQQTLGQFGQCHREPASAKSLECSQHQRTRRLDELSHRSSFPAGGIGTRAHWGTRSGDPRDP